MTPVAALGAFVLAAGLLTLTPGLDTMLVMRTAATDGRWTAVLAALGIGLGCLVWGAAVALGLGVLLEASKAAYVALTWAGAVYLAWIGLTLLLKPRRTFDPDAAPDDRRGSAWLLRGLLTNLLNPKIGVFYVSFLPQFVPAGWPAAATVFGLATLHVLLGLAWFSIVIAGMGSFRRALQRPGLVAWLDRATGAVFIGFGLRLVVSRPG